MLEQRVEEPERVRRAQTLGQWYRSQSQNARGVIATFSVAALLVALGVGMYLGLKMSNKDILNRVDHTAEAHAVTDSMQFAAKKHADSVKAHVRELAAKIPDSTTSVPQAFALRDSVVGIELREHIPQNDWLDRDELNKAVTMKEIDDVLRIHGNAKAYGNDAYLKEISDSLQPVFKDQVEALTTKIRAEEGAAAARRFEANTKKIAATRNVPDLGIPRTAGILSKKDTVLASTGKGTCFGECPPPRP